MSNQKEGGVLDFLVYQDKVTGKQCGLCVQLGLYAEAEDIETLRTNLAEAARGYVRTVMKDNLSDSLLEVEPTQEHLSIYQEAIKSLRPRDSDNPSAGVYSDDISVFTKPLDSLLVGSLR